MADSSDTRDASGFQRPDAILSGVAVAAFEAFNAMQATKQRHYELLQLIDDRRVRYGLSPSAIETERLAAMLADHDAQVTRFTTASNALKNADPDAHKSLFAYIGSLEQARPPVTH